MALRCAQPETIEVIIVNTHVQYTQIYKYITCKQASKAKQSKVKNRIKENMLSKEVVRNNNENLATIMSVI